MLAAEDFIINRAIAPNPGEDACLRTGEQYRESLRDGRRVIVDGREVEDVTRCPGLAAGIDTFAALFDAQFDPATRDVTTCVDRATGRRIATGWLVPRTRVAVEAGSSSSRTAPSAGSDAISRRRGV